MSTGGEIRKSKAKMRRWYMSRAVDRIVDLMGGRCSCYPYCRRGPVRATLVALIRGLRRYT